MTLLPTLLVAAALMGPPSWLPTPTAVEKGGVWHAVNCRAHFPGRDVESQYRRHVCGFFVEGSLPNHRVRVVYDR